MDPEAVHILSSQQAPEEKPGIINKFPNPKKPNLLIVILILTAVSALATIIYFANQIKKLKQELKQATQTQTFQTPQPQPSIESSSKSPTPTTNPTAEWKSYVNTAYGYSISYPSAFRTQVLSAGAGTKEAPPNAGNLYIYNPSDEEPYINRYINLEVLGLEPTYGSGWTREQVTLGGRNATKFVYSSQKSRHVTYLVPLTDNQQLLEIVVSNTQDKKSLSNQILSTFQFLD